MSHVMSIHVFLRLLSMEEGGHVNDEALLMFAHQLHVILNHLRGLSAALERSGVGMTVVTVLC